MEEIRSSKKNNDSIETSSLKRIGNFIKEARLSKDQTIEELASNLKIGAHQLKAIEDGNEEYLPEKIFIKAMVKRITEKLKLDEDFIMRELYSEDTQVKIEEPIEKDSNKSQRKPKVKNKSFLGVGLFIIVSGLCGFLASSLIFNFFTESYQNVFPTQENKR